MFKVKNILGSLVVCCTFSAIAHAASIPADGELRQCLSDAKSDFDGANTQLKTDYDLGKQEAKDAYNQAKDDCRMDPETRFCVDGCDLDLEVCVGGVVHARAEAFAKCGADRKTARTACDAMKGSILNGANLAKYFSCIQKASKDFSRCTQIAVKNSSTARKACSTEAKTCRTGCTTEIAL